MTDSELSPVARLYTQGRYRRASVSSGPGIPLVPQSVAASWKQKAELRWALIEDLTKQRDELERQLAATGQTAQSEDASASGDWRGNVEYLLSTYPGSIRVHEGGGPEDLIASLCVTFIKLRDIAMQQENGK